MSKVISYLTLGLFVVSFFSGIVILFAYHPSMAFKSTQMINYIIPYGLFFRKLHYFSSELFLIFVILHIGFELYKKDIRLSLNSWNFSIIGFLATIFLLFSGFVLKGDLSAKSAAEVSFNILKDTPFLDKLLPLIKDNFVFYYKFFIWHIFLLPLILIYSIYKHIDYVVAKREYVMLGVGVSLLASYIFKMPLDITPTAKIATVSSPWFFVGAENLLKHGISPIVVLLSLFLPIGLLFYYKLSRFKLAIFSVLMLWMVFYILVSMVKL